MRKAFLFSSAAGASLLLAAAAFAQAPTGGGGGGAAPAGGAGTSAPAGGGAPTSGGAGTSAPAGGKRAGAWLPQAEALRKPHPVAPLHQELLERAALTRQRPGHQAQLPLKQIPELVAPPGQQTNLLRASQSRLPPRLRAARTSAPNNARKFVTRSEMFRSGKQQTST